MVYENYYSFSVKKCCNILQVHKKSVTTNLAIVSLEQHKTFPKLIPGNKICYKCLHKLESTSDPQNQIDTYCDADTSFSQPRESLNKLNKSLEAVDISPIRSKLSDEQLKRKIEKKGDAIKSKFMKIQSGEDSHIRDDSECDEIVSSMQRFVEQLKEKYRATEKVSDKIKLLTLVPDHWTHKQTMEEFCSTDYIVKRARKLRQENGLLGTLTSGKNKVRISENITEVKRFYENDENSRLLPGRKDCITINTVDGRIQKQKRLVLLNLKELYQKWKEENPENKIGFSTFASLRPKWCVLAGSSGTHSVCVCIHHQNPKLKIQTFDSTLTCSKLMTETVCSLDNRECMLHECDNCPREDKLIDLLQTIVPGEDDDEIQYPQWVSTDRCNLLTIKEPRIEFIEKLCQEIVQLTVHHYITKTQSKYLSKSKQELRENEAIIQLDYSENYTMTIQDAVQSSYFDAKQATVHPYVVYYKQNGDLKSKSYCVISNHLTHDHTAVAIFNREIVTQIKLDLPWITFLHYWSDGSAAQYKNRFNLRNLVEHENYTGIEAMWHFFSTSHGKGPCDGLGGTVKRLTSKASLQGKIITTPQEMFQHADENIPGISFKFIDAKIIPTTTRFPDAKPIRGIRAFHCFAPTVDSLIAYRCSGDGDGTRFSMLEISDDIGDKCSTQSTVQPTIPCLRSDDVELKLKPVAGDFVHIELTSKKMKKLFVGEVLQVDGSELEISFMKRNDDSTYCWPANTDRSWECVSAVRKILSYPEMTSSSTSNRQFFTLTFELKPEILNIIVYQ